MNNSFSFIFLGSTHGFLNDFEKQREWIIKVNPEFVLSEELEDLKMESETEFKEFFKKKKVSRMTSFNEVKELAILCFERGIKLIGIDFSNFGFNDNLQRVVKKQENPTKAEEEQIENLANKRERYHLSKILDYKNKTSKPIVIILGCWHLREGSLLRNKLKNYKIITPIGKNGKVLLSPEGAEGFRYGEITSPNEKN